MKPVQALRGLFVGTRGTGFAGPPGAPPRGPSEGRPMGELFKVIGLAVGEPWEAIGFAQGDRSHTL